MILNHALQLELEKTSGANLNDFKDGPRALCDLMTAFAYLQGEGISVPMQRAVLERIQGSIKHVQEEAATGVDPVKFADLEKLNDALLLRIKESEENLHARREAEREGKPAPAEKAQPDPELIKKVEELEELLEQATKPVTFPSRADRARCNARSRMDHLTQGEEMVDDAP